jgi:hypothetical protein
MGLFAFRRAKEREAAKQAASIPVSKPKRKKRKPKTKVSPDGNINSGDNRSS